MEFSGQYLTYVEYTNLGGTLHPTPFNFIEFEARRRIDGQTMNRLVNGQNIPKEVKLCIYNLIGIVQKYVNEANRDKTSETVGSYSVTYKDIKQILEEKESEINDIITNYLFGVIYNGEHLLYSGV